MIPSFAFDNSYARLPGKFYARVEPTPVAAPALIILNHALALALGLDPESLAGAAGVEILAGNQRPDRGEPLAMAYAGHQFGHFVPQLGDGRAILLGEVIHQDGHRRDIQLKGAGPTPFSRRGDGRAALGPVLREYLVSETMAAYGIPTTRALAAVTTGERVTREAYLPGAILTRVAKSHVRVGTFQFFASRGDVEGVRLLADHVIGRLDPTLALAANPYRAFLDQVIARQAALVAQWMWVGFIHGVMNTDNMSVMGETIDFGPCAFLDEYDPATVFSSIDRAGRYAYDNQPAMAHWNLTRLAECLLPLLAGNEAASLAQAEEALAAFPAAFERAYISGLRRKLGLLTERPEDLLLGQDLLGLMARAKADFTLTFHALNGAASAAAGDGAFLAHLGPSPEVALWLGRWRERLAQEDVTPAQRLEAMRQANPRLIPRNHRLEEVIQAAVEGNFAPFHSLHQALADPFGEEATTAHYAQPPQPDERVLQTFCGT